MWAVFVGASAGDRNRPFPYGLGLDRVNVLKAPAGADRGGGWWNDVEVRATCSREPVDVGGDEY